MDIEIKVKQGPVIVKGNQGRGIDNEYPLWDGIFVREQFPATKDAAFYYLMLRKSVFSHHDVDSVEGMLLIALEWLSRVWQFAGGSLMSTKMMHIQHVPLFESNAKEIKEHLLREAGLKQVSASVSLHNEIIGTYRCFPLRPAVELCLKGKEDPDLKMLFDYYYEACLDSTNWFTHLYKVHDLLERLFGRSCKKAKSSLAISDEDWGLFEKVINSFRHHPKRKSIAKCITPQEIHKVKLLAFKWINTYLRKYKNFCL